MRDASDYTIAIRRGHFDGENCFEARVREFPDLVEYGDSFDEAYNLALDAIETTLEIFVEKDRAFPEPYSVADEYSGRVTLRVPKSLHRDLVMQAEEEGVSLNQHIVNALSFNTGYCRGVKHSPVNYWITVEPESQPKQRGSRQINRRVVPLRDDVA